ncbi:hypothetical protein BB561_006550 [Smittium simulii]|uniref:CCHC-type domain-containing protein n=1 Tax=Smittium simulii TaxID=133385 RepID=A0A2T9Y362_9FUNG|nr:hypothetical protein BB561_006550 [Smittium simulii]
MLIRKDTIGQFIPRLYKLANLINNEPIKEALRGLVDKLLGAKSKLSLSQLKLMKEGTQIITIPSFKKVNIINLLDEIKNLFTPHGTIVDVSAFKLRNKNVIHLFGLKFLFKISNEKFEISSFLEIDNELMAMTYKGCNAACNYCKKPGHWRSECSEITHKHSEKATKQTNIAKTTVKLPTSTEFNIKKLLDNSEKKPSVAVHNSSDEIKKNGKKKGSVV